MIKKILQNIFKSFFYSLFLKVYGKITNSITSKNDNRINVKITSIEKDLKYNIYKITNGRLYTDRVHDTAIILDNKIVEGPSFQLRYKHGSEIYNSSIENNVVFNKGTPRVLKKLKGKALSLLSGGGANENYWHWLFDVLPRLHLCSKYIKLEEINYFILPNLLKKFQNETLDCLNISITKRLSSKKYMHIKADELIVTDHPVVITGSVSKDMQNMPHWIVQWLKKSFVMSGKVKDKKYKVYIDRTDKSRTNLRTIDNENEVKEFLLENDFVSINLSKTKFSDQVDLFNNADCVVGLHGAGFANLAFCNPKTKVIEFRGFDAGPVIGNLAKINKLNYHSIIAKTSHKYNYGFPNQQGSIKVPIKELNEILKS